MASLRELRRKIKSVKSTQQITRAMKMVAAARMRRAQDRIVSARPFAVKMHDLLADLAGRLDMQEELMGHAKEELHHPLLQERAGQDSAVFLVSSDKGLCGSFNTSLFRKTLEYMNEHREARVSMFVAGRKGRDYFRRQGMMFAGEYLGVMKAVAYAHAELIGNEIISYYLSHPVARVVMIYNEFKSVLQQKAVVEQLLPAERPRGQANKNTVDFLYEPSRNVLLEALLPRFVKGQIYRALLESYASEMGARMTAMDNATKNAGELIDHLTLVSNKLRQASITKEILEVVSGAEALG